jgi:hypothetical protein
MPAPEVRNLTGYAVLWARSAIGGYGQFKVSSPIEIRVRWEDVRQESNDPQNTVESSPVTAFVAQVIEVGSLMWYGRLADLPDSPTDLYKVTAYNGTPDIKGRVSSHVVTLTRYGDSLPEVVE